MKKILVINGPNLNMLGIRERTIYGSGSYDDLVAYIESLANELDLNIEIFQSNYEGAIIEKIQKAYNVFDGIVINPGAFTHYSYGIYDALLSVSIKTIEVHLSDITKREEFRKVSVISPACKKQIYGKGFEGYKEAFLEFI